MTALRTTAAFAALMTLLAACDPMDEARGTDALQTTPTEGEAADETTDPMS